MFQKKFESMSQGSVQMEDVKPSISTSNSQSEDGTAVEARFSDLCKVSDFFFFGFVDYLVLICNSHWLIPRSCNRPVCRLMKAYRSRQ